MDYATTFVNEFSNQLAINQRGIRNMRSWYVFSDKRPGGIIERFERDAKEFFEFEKMLRRAGASGKLTR